MSVIYRSLLVLRDWLIPVRWLQLAKKIILFFFSEQLAARRRRINEKNEEINRTSASQFPYDYALNSEFYNIHKNEELFILCTGPSIKEANLSLLRGKTCMSVSNFYKHPLYANLRPKYHVTPNIILESFQVANPNPEYTIKNWFSEMDARTLEAILFFGSRQIDLIKNEGLFQSRTVRFVHMDNAERLPNTNNIDITKTICSVQSVPILCLIIGLYMGFKRIYLLGVDHDEMRKDKYEYFFQRDQMKFRDASVKDDGTPIDSRYVQFQTHLFLWEQYLAIANLAHQRNVEIINLNPSSFLDIFPKKALEKSL